MKIFDRVKNLFGSTEILKADETLDHPGWSDYRYSGTTALSMSMVHLASAWAATGIGVNQEKTAEVPFVLKRGEDQIALKDSPLLWIMNLQDYIEGISFWLDLAGEAFLAVERDHPMDEPESLTLLPSVSLDLLTDYRWRYTPIVPSGQSTPIYYEPWQLIHIKRYGFQGQDWRGVSPLYPLLETISTDRAVTKYLKDWAESPAAMSGILSPGASMVSKGGVANFTTDQARQIAENVKKQFKSFTRTQRLLMLDGRVEFTPAPKDGIEGIDIPSQRKMSRTEILAALGLNEVMVGIYENVKSYEGTKTAKTQYYQDTIVPRCKRIARGFTSLLALVAPEYDLMPDFSMIPELGDWRMKAEDGAFAIEKLGWTPLMADRYFELGGEGIEGAELSDMPLDRFIGLPMNPGLPPGNPPADEDE